jgi:hypothetical protein
LADKYPDLCATLVDSPQVCDVASEFIQQAQGGNRISIAPGDLLADDFAIEPGDMVLLSQVLHELSKEECERLIRKTHDWTLPGGIIVLHEFLLNEDRAGPLYPALFSLNMLMTTPSGDAYTRQDLRRWLEHAGYHEISYHDAPGPSTFVVGHKK